MDQHTFLELVVLGAAIALSGYIGYAIGWARGRATAYVQARKEVWPGALTEARREVRSAVYYGEDENG